MNYKLDEEQARQIAKDFQYLVGEMFSAFVNVPIEKVFASKRLFIDRWEVFLSTYTGERDNIYGLIEHTNLWTTLFEYLAESEKENDFDPKKYGLSLENNNE